MAHPPEGIDVLNDTSQRTSADEDAKHEGANHAQRRPATTSGTAARNDGGVAAPARRACRRRWSKKAVIKDRPNGNERIAQLQRLLEERQHEVDAL